MPSSLIIVALAAAWLVVLVPMIARKRQQIARTTDSAMAARVVRSGGRRAAEGGEEFAMSEKSGRADEIDSADLDEVDEDLKYLEELEGPAEEIAEVDDEEEVDEEPEAPARSRYERADGGRRRYRPGRGGFDPEAAEIAAKAKYAYRQRVVLALIVAVVVTAALAGFLWPVLWWVNGAADIALVGYLGYLRRQVRIENEIRQRRLARIGGGTHPEPRGTFTDDEEPAPLPRAEPEHEVEIAPTRREVVGNERKPSPMSRMRRHAVVVDVDDEDPAFEELDEPGHRTFRRAVGE
ncbi:divisome protein SepX/GlpR [Amycolatopsis minnesotensis]|uniref:Transmembrane protein n=1 Tax=Amycolatopsis minnesotensis TaxID=337894 RepID=A0ABP5D185_9PSEU